MNDLLKDLARLVDDFRREADAFIARQEEYGRQLDQMAEMAGEARRAQDKATQAITSLKLKYN